MAAIPCFTCTFVRNTPHIESGIALAQGILTLGEGHTHTKFDTVFFSNSMRNVGIMRLRRVCDENIKKLPHTASAKGVLVLVRTAVFGTASTLPGYSRKFKRNPVEVISGRSLKYPSGPAPVVYTDSLWFLMPSDEVLVVEQGSTSHSGIVLSWNEGKLMHERIPRAYFDNDSE